MITRELETEKRGWQKELDKHRAKEFATYMGLGDSLRSAMRFQDALIYYNRALAVDESSDKARLMSDSMMSIIIADAAAGARDTRREQMTSRRIEVALEEMKSGRFNEAIMQYELALEIDPANQTVAGLLQAARSTRTVEMDKIRRDARRHRESGEHASALLEWNRLLTMQSDDSEARQGVESARNQLRANGLVASAVASINERKYQNALTYLEQAQRIKPDDKSIQSLLSDARAKSAPATNLEDIKSSEERWAVYLRGLEAYQAGNYSEAIRNWESLRQYYPNNPDLEKNISQARQRISTEGGATQD
jgi:tetratricopeptide (TPR) repeat protein